jgi:F-box-like
VSASASATRDDIAPPPGIPVGVGHGEEARDLTARLPAKVLLNVFRWLDAVSLSRVSATCRRWRRICVRNEDALWCRLYASHGYSTLSQGELCSSLLGSALDDTRPLSSPIDTNVFVHSRLASASDLYAALSQSSSAAKGRFPSHSSVATRDSATAAPTHLTQIDEEANSTRSSSLDSFGDVDAATPSPSDFALFDQSTALPKTQTENDVLRFIGWRVLFIHRYRTAKSVSSKFQLRYVQ